MNIASKLSSLESGIKDAILALYPDTLVDVVLNMPTDKTKAHMVCNSCFSVSKQVGVSPIELAEKVCEKLNASEFSSQASFSAAAPGFINLVFSAEFLSFVLEELVLASENYGKNNSLSGQTWLVEHTSPNPNKPMHVGHLRNNLIGMSLARLAEFSGAKVVYDAVDNNRGIAIAKAMWGYMVSKKKDGGRVEDVHVWVESREEWLTPEDLKQKSDHFVGDCYQVGSSEYKENEEVSSKIKKMVVDWEAGESDTHELWKQVLEYAHKGIDETLSMLGSRWDKVWHESDHYKMGKDFVEEGLSKGIFKKLPDGAVVTNLSKYGIADTIVLKSDGTSLYITQDFALTKLKKETFKADKLIWVIGPEQSLAMKQVFAVCEQLGIGKVSEFSHVSFGLVSVIDDKGRVRKMSSRLGDALLVDTLIEDVTSILISSGREYTKEVAQSIGVSAIKFSILKPARNTDIVVNLDKALGLDGDSGVYLLYTYARIHSLLTKHELDFGKYDYEFSESEREILVRLFYFPLLVENALNGFAPNLIVEYLFDLAHLFNSLYSSEKFLVEDKSESDKKILLSFGVSNVFRNAFSILGVTPFEKI